MSAKKSGKGVAKSRVKARSPSRSGARAGQPVARARGVGAPTGRAVVARPAISAAGRVSAPRPAVAATPVPVRPAPVTVVPGRAPPVVAGPVIVDPRLPIFKPDPVGNIFDGARPGHAVVRPADLVALRIELHNLVIQPGTPPRLKKTGSGASHLVLHFPPQAITEETFFETRPAGTTNPPAKPGVPSKPEPGGSEELTGPPVRARISGESRVAFVVPDGFDVPYTLEGVLGAVEELALSVTANAKPPGAGGRRISMSELFDARVGRLSAAQRAALSSFVLRSLRIAAVQGDMATLTMRQAIGGPGLRAVKTGVAGVGIARVPGPVRPVAGARPALPEGKQTAIELPWRLILSPHAGERWRHAKTPVTSLATQRTELWHSRLVAPRDDGSVIEPPRPDAQRTVRAIWALTGEGSTQAMEGSFPATLPQPSTSPFRMPLDDFDRFQFVHLSSNFSSRKYAPDAVDTNLLMLSALGGWLDSRGAWSPPAGMSVEEWVHRAAMARDHYVRVV